MLVAGSGVVGAVKAHRLALETYPKHFHRLELSHRSAERLRHGWIVGSGFVLGCQIWPHFIL